MKKSLKGELVSLAHRILQLKESSSYEQLTQEAREVYEKLTILSYVKKIEKFNIPTKIDLEKIEESFQAQEEVAQSKQENKEIKKEPTSPLVPTQIITTNKKTKPDDQDLNSNQRLFKKEEPAAEKIEEPVINSEASTWNQFIALEDIKGSQKNDMFDIGGEYATIPVFDRVEEENEKPKNLNERLKSGLKVGLNDKLAFIKHLFDGNNADYLRVVSQLESFTTVTEAQIFISQIIKPDYNNWKDKEEYEDRFRQIVINKFE